MEKKIKFDLKIVAAGNKEKEKDGKRNEKRMKERSEE